ncbi:hypothetical protein BH11MYX2_BH11MYX2_32620 [soil metagenome]
MRTVGWFAVGVLSLMACGDDGGGSGHDAGDDTPIDAHGSGDAGADARPDAAPNAMGCTTFATLNSTFTNTICGPWGAASGSANVTNEMSAKLRIAPSGTMTSDGECTSSAMVTIPDGGFFIQVPTPIVSAAGYASLRLDGLDVAINSRDNKLRLTNATGSVTVAQVPFVTGAMLWWRLRPDRGTNEIVGEYSADANAWYEVGRVARTLTTASTLLVTAGSENPTASVGVAELDNLNVCP